MRKPRRTAEEMFPLVEQYLKGSQTAEAFCAEHGISRSQLCYWRHKNGKKAAASKGAAFVEIGASAPREQVQMEVAFPSGVRLRFFVPVSSSFLATLVKP